MNWITPTCNNWWAGYQPDIAWLCFAQSTVLILTVPSIIVLIVVLIHKRWGSP